MFVVTGYFSCYDGQELPTSARCNGIPDCVEGEDETNCVVDLDGVYDDVDYEQVQVEENIEAYAQVIGIFLQTFIIFKVSVQQINLKKYLVFKCFKAKNL
jgi:hypothetical protein